MRNYPDEVELEDRPCPNGCGDIDRLLIEGRDRIHGIPGQFRVVQCRKCKLIRTNPRPTPQTIGSYYPEDYAPYLAGGAPVVVSSSRLKKIIRRWLGLDVKRAPDMTPGRLLEIGCASGDYLQQMRTVGWDVEGIEFSEFAAMQARAKGLSVQIGTVESASAPSAKFDVVAAWMVLEHLHEPIESLRRIRCWLKPGGYLIASVPDAGAIERRIFGERWYALHLPNHLYHYDSQSLAVVLNQAGWRLNRVVWQRNCNNLLWSVQYVLQDRGWRRSAAAITWLRTAKAASKARIILGWLLGVTRQSGRIEFWAQPLTEKAPDEVSK